MGSTVLSVYA